MVPRLLVFSVLGTLLLPSLSQGGDWESGFRPTHEVPFDDLDPAVAQEELARHVDRFVHSLETQWGMNQEKVRRHVAGDPHHADDNALIYGRTLLGHAVVEGYDFRGGALICGRYVLLQRPVNGLNEFIDYYAAVKASLTATYGAPQSDRTIWENALYQSLPDYWGVAVQIGHLRYAATWRTLAGDLTFELAGHYHNRLTIEYRNHAVEEPLPAAQPAIHLPPLDLHHTLRHL